jgi:hypothetical protein
VAGVVEEHVVDAGDAVVAVGLAEGAAVVDDVPGVAFGDMEEGMVGGVGADGGEVMKRSCLATIS